MGILQDFRKIIADVEKENERRFELNKLPEGIGKASTIKQGMICEYDDGYVRVREQDGKYTMTAKYWPDNQESETEISKEMFEGIWSKVKRPQEKSRYTYQTKDDHDWIIDEMEDGKIVAEVETSRKNSKVEVPEELDVKKEIVYD